MRAALLLALLAGCAGRDGCRPVEARFENASGMAVEQLYLARDSGQAADLIVGGALLSRASLPLRFGGPGRYTLRAVWVDGRAIEMGLDGCRTRRITLLDGGLRAE